MARENRFIVNKFGQKHSYDNLVTIMQDLTPQEVKSVLITLGLDGVIDDGGLVPAYSADIVSSEERFLNPNIAHNITLTGKLYNYYQEASDKAVSWKWTRNSDSPEADKVWVKHAKEITLTDADLTTKIVSQKVFFTLEVTIEDGTKFTDTIDFSTVVSLNAVQIKQSHSLFMAGDPAEITLTAVTTGLSPTSYKWYVNDILKSVSRIYKIPSGIISNGQVANVRLEVIDVKNITYSDYVSIPKLSVGSNGEPGVPGPPGQDGRPSYTWIKYADDAVGTDMSEYPTKENGTFREWMGIATNKDTPVESPFYTDYTWSKYIGEDGVPGENGYMWIVYSQFPEGLNQNNQVEVHQDPYDEGVQEFMVYMGIAYNKQEKIEPNFNAMTPTVFEEQGFIWSKIKGEDGHTGYVLDSDNDIIALPADSEGTVIGTPTGNRSVFSLFYGNTQINLSQMYAEFTQTGGVVFTNSRGNTTTSSTDWIEVSSLTDDTGTVTLTVYADSEANKVVAKTTVQVAKFKNTPVFNIVTSVSSINVVPGVGTAPEVITPTTLEVKVMKNTGYEVMETPEGTLTYKYNYQTGDGQPLEPDASGKYTIPVSNAGNPKHIEIQYFHPIVSNKIADRETVPFVRDGKNGDPGAPGQPGDPGQSGAPGVPGSRGPMPRMLEWRVGYTYYRNAEYRDYIYYRSTNPTYDGWYCVKDVPVNLYNTTDTGIEEFRAVANSGSPDTAIFQKQEFTDSQIFGTIIAEGANLAGFIFRNQQLFSQTGMDTTNETPQFSNLLLNGLLGFLKFAEKLYIDKDGITFFDTSKRPRIRFGFEDTEEGIPYLRFLAADGTILWEAGKDYTKWITQGTTQPSWSSQYSYANLMLGDDKDAVPSQSSIESAIDSMVTDKDGVINRLRLLTEADAAYWKSTSMPSKSKTVNKGDTASGQDLYEGWYAASALNMLTNADVAAGTLTGLIADGWYVGNFERGYGAVPGYELYGGMVGGILEFKVYAVYILKGQVYREHSYVVHQQTENI